MSRARIHSMVPFLGVAALAAVADQVTKWCALGLTPGLPVEIGPFLALRLGFNTGISFGLLAGTGASHQIILVALTISIIAFLAWFAGRSPAERIGLGLIVGGAIGNLIDRIVRGRVTDFIDVHAGGWHWPAFNLADGAITLGVVWIIAVNLKIEKKKEMPQ